MKKLLSVLLAVLLLATCIPLGTVSVSAITYSGITGDCTWTLEDGHLTISGNGQMGDYKDKSPWADNKVISATIERGVTSIGKNAFLWCTKLTSVTIPDTVTTIGFQAFELCSSLTSVTIPASVTAIGMEAFSNCDSLTTVTIPDGVTIIGDHTFAYCDNLTSITIPDGVTTIGKEAFSGCISLASVTIPDSVTDIYRSAFYGCESLVSVTLGNRVTSISWSVFDSCTSLISVVIPDSVKEISWYAFAGCDSLTSVIIGDGVTTIDESAFVGCDNLTSVIIGNSVTKICENAFGGCNNLTKLILPASIEVIDDAFDYGDNLSVYYAGSEEDRNKVQINRYNHALLDATWYYNFHYSCEHEWANGVCTFCKEKSPTQVAITKQPKTGYAKMGYTATVSVKASGDDLRYEWYIRNDGQSKYSRSSVTKATYTVTMQDKSKDRRLYCRIYDKYGNMVQTKTVILREAVSVVVQPKSTTAKKGATAKVSLRAYGDGLTYQWYVKNEGQTKYSKSSVTKSTYSCTMSSKSKNRLLYCVVTDKYGKTVTTNTIRLKMA